MMKVEDKRSSRNKRQQNHTKYLRTIGAERDGLFNIEVVDLVFVQDARDRKKFHIPGGDTVDLKWIYSTAEKKNWGTPRRRYIQKPTR